MIRVLIADDTPQMAARLDPENLQQNQIQIVSRRKTKQEVVAAAAALQPDVLIVNLDMCQRTGVEVIAEIRQQLPTARFLALSIKGSKEDAKLAIKEKCVGFLPIGASSNAIQEAIQKVYQGQRIIKIEKKVAAKGEFLVLEKDQEPRIFRVTSTDIKVGRSDDVDLVLPNVSVSREHARIYVTERGWRIIDLKSRNGVLVNGEMVTKKRLKNGDQIQLGKYLLVLYTDVVEEEFQQGWSPIGNRVAKYVTARVDKQHLDAVRKNIQKIRNCVLYCEADKTSIPLGKQSVMFGGKEGIPVTGSLGLGYIAMINWDGSSHVLKKLSFLTTVEVNGSSTKQYTLVVNDRFRIGKTWFQYLLKSNQK